VSQTDSSVLTGRSCINRHLMPVCMPADIVLSLPWPALSCLCSMVVLSAASTLRCAGPWRAGSLTAATHR
jgi:hypothetical protein